MVPPLKKTGTKEDRTMKTKIYLRVFAAVTMLAAFSCAKEIEPEVTVVGTTEETNQVRTYSVTVHAEKGEPATKALNLTGNTLQASWEEGEVVDVYKGDDKIGTLTAQSTGMSTTLKGTIHATLAEGDDLILKFCSPNYTTQDGTLEYIAANCDYATAEVTVSTIDDNTGAISISDATFVSHQAIVKFTLKEDDGTTAVKASVLTFQSGETSITVSPIPASSELFVAVPEISAGRINLTATDSDDCRYGYNKSNAELTGGKYYEVGVRMSLIVTTESELNAALVNHKRIMLGADIPLNAYVKIGQNGSQDITLDLNGHKLSRSLTAADANGHVIEVFGSGTLTIKDSSGDDSGQISGGWANNGGAICNYGTLSFQGGTITACKGVNGGGIINNSGCTLQITGGLITNCRSDAGGGAIVNHGTATISGCTFRGNTATTRGGAIWSDGTLTVQDCTFTGNEALANGGDGQNEGDGGAIHVQAGTTTLTDVTITNNTSKDAGAIYVTSGATLNLGGTSTISGNRSTEHGGGGIVNNGTANLSGSVRITGNNCHTYGGGIWNNGILKMEGDIQVKDNTRGRSQPNNVYLKSSRVINVTGSLAGSGIGLSMENNGTATSGLGSNGDLSCFFCDNAAATEIGLVNGEATLSIRTDVVYYVERGWENSSLTEEYKSRNDCIVLAGTDSGATYNLESGRWYVVKGSNVQYKAVIAPSGDGANLILCDGATLTSLIIINEGCRLNIYAQSEDSGKIVAEVPHVESLDFPAGIGSEGTSRMETLQSTAATSRPGATTIRPASVPAEVSHMRRIHPAAAP